jgi:hypothetical protein
MVGPGSIADQLDRHADRGNTFTFAVTNTVAQAEVTNAAYFSDTQQTGSDSAVYSAGGWKVLLPLVMRGFTP